MKFKFFRNHFSKKKTNRFLLLFLTLDILFILAHVIFIYLIFIRVEFDWSITDPFLLNLDGGYPEMFQYLKYFIIMVATLRIVLSKKIYNYISWFFLFTLLLLDDALQFHERFAAWVVEKFNIAPAFGLRPQDLGELTYVGIFGPILLLLLLFTYYYGSKRIRRTYIDIGLLFAIFLFFGIGVDVLHQLVAIGDNRYTLLFMILLEDGGEMITLSILTWYFLFLTISDNKHNTYIYEYFLKKRAKANDDTLSN